MPYHPRILHRSVNARSSRVSSHSIISLSFEAPVMLKRGYGYFFYLGPLQGLGSYYHDHRDAWAHDCKKSSGHSVDCAEVDGRSNYTPPIILSEECANNATLITIPLPQIDSGIRYGLKTSLPDMIVDVLANTAIAPDSLDDGFLFTFTSNTGLSITAHSLAEAPRVFARLLQPADVHRAPLSEPIVVQYSSAGFLPTAVPVQLRRQFGETVLKQAVGQSCVRLARDEAADTTTVTIEVARCLRALQPLTNYEVFIPSTAWKGSTAESPSSFLFSFFTRDGGRDSAVVTNRVRFSGSAECHGGGGTQERAGCSEVRSARARGRGKGACRDRRPEEPRTGVPHAGRVRGGRVHRGGRPLRGLGESDALLVLPLCDLPPALGGRGAADHAGRKRDRGQRVFFND